MSFRYGNAPTEGALRQGEILGPLWDHETSYPPVALTRGRRVAVTSTLWDLRVVLSPDCDLLWDYEARFQFPDPDDRLPIEQHPSSVNQVLLCDLQSRGQIRPRFHENQDGWQRVDRNQDERYHRLPAAEVGAGGLSFHDLFIDFKKVSSMHTSALYEGIALGDVKRIAMIPEIYMLDLVHRFYAFLSRVAV